MQLIRPLQPGGEPTIRTLLRMLLLLWAAFTLQPALRAQGISFASAQSTVASGMTATAGVAVDRAGNVYFSDFFSGLVAKVPAGGGLPVAIGSGFIRPMGLAVDLAGNVYVADSFKNVVVKISPGGTQTILASGLGGPMAVAVDASGNVFVAEDANNRVLKISPGGAQTALGSGLNRPFGVAVDAAGNVFIADTSNNRVVEVPSDGGAQTTVSSGLKSPYGVAVDGAGNVLIADTFNRRVIKAGPAGQTTVIGGLSNPEGVAVDSAGDIFIADSDAGRVLELQFHSVGFGAVNTCPSGQSSPTPCNRSLSLNYDVIMTSTLTAPAVVTEGAANLDFQLGAGSTCMGTVAGGTSCTVNVTFAPLAPGVRIGAVELTDSFGNLLATTLVYGQGQGPLIVFDPAIQSTLVTGLNLPFGLARDGAGNLFVADYNNSQVTKIPADGSARTTVGSGISYPFGVAVDGAGNVFIGDFIHSRVVKVPAGGGPQTTFGTGLNDPTGVAVTGAGDILIADYSNDRVVRVPADGGPQTTVTSDLHRPYGVAVNGAGDIFIADTGNNRVVKIPAGGGAQITLAGGLASPYFLTVDAANNLFISDTGNGRVLKMPADGGALTTVASGLNWPTGLVLDGAGNIIVSETFSSRLVQLKRSNPPALSFADTSAGTSGSSLSVTIENDGNQPLIAVTPGIAFGANFQQVPGSGTPADCTANFSLAPAANCSLSISFVPQAVGAIQSTAVLTDNSLNASTATQAVALSGTGILTTSTTVSAGSGQCSDNVTLSVLVGPVGAKFSANLQFQVGGTNACLVAVSGSGTYTCTYAIAQGAGNYSVGATLTPAPAESLVHGSSGTSTLTVANEDASILPSAGNTATIQVNAPGGTAGPITLQGTLQQSADGSLGDINKAGVTVTLVPAVAGAANITCPVTNLNGALSATCANVPVDAYTVQWSIGGSYFQGPVVKGVLAVYDPSLGFVTGSGSVQNRGVAADFALSLKYLKDGKLSGGITYAEHRPTGDVTVSTTTLSSMSLVGTTAIIYGQATVNGVAGYTLQLTVTDNGTPGVNRDTFGLQVSGGGLAPSISFVPAAITAGNIQTH